MKIPPHFEIKKGKGTTYLHDKVDMMGSFLQEEEIRQK